MKYGIISMIVIFVAISFIMTGHMSMTGYYAEPSAYGFHHIMAAQLNLSIGISLILSVIGVFMARQIEKKFF